MKPSEATVSSINIWGRRIAPLLFGLAGLLAASWAVWLNFSVTAVASNPTQVPTQVQVPIDMEDLLPSYLPFDDRNLISRQVDIYTQIPHRLRVEVLRYTVQKGDAIFGIACKFDLEPETYSGATTTF